MRGVIIFFAFMAFFAPVVVVALVLYISGEREKKIATRIARMRKRGEERAEELKLAEEAVCILCSKPIYVAGGHPIDGVYTKGAWHHDACIKGEST